MIPLDFHRIIVSKKRNLNKDLNDDRSKKRSIIHTYDSNIVGHIRL